MNPYRWVMLGLAWAAYASFGLVSASLAPLVTPITAELGITYTQMGMILGAWQLAYIGVAYNVGRVLDRVGLRRSLPHPHQLTLLQCVRAAPATAYGRSARRT